MLSVGKKKKDRKKEYKMLTFRLTNIFHLFPVV